MRHSIRRPLRVGMWVGIVAAILGVINVFVLHPEDLREFYQIYVRFGVAALLGSVYGQFIAVPLIFSLIGGGVVWLWGLIFNHPTNQTTAPSDASCESAAVTSGDALTALPPHIPECDLPPLPGRKG